MKKILVALSLLLTLVISLKAIAQEDYPRTPSGKPDFNGDYDISTLTPFERPTSYGNRRALNAEEVQALRDREMGIRARDAIASDPDRDAPEQGGNIGSYNDFWFDRGNDGFVIDGEYRTSILTYWLWRQLILWISLINLLKAKK